MILGINLDKENKIIILFIIILSYY